MKNLLFILLLLSFSTFGQANYADSLKKDRQRLTNAKNDTSRVQALRDLCSRFSAVNPDSALYFGQKALNLARKINFPRGEAVALNALGFTQIQLGNFSTAQKLFLNSLQIAEKNNLIYEKADAYHNIGNNYNKAQDYKNALIYLKKGRALFDSIKINDMYVISEKVIGTVFFRLNQLDSALYYTQLAYNDMLRFKGISEWTKPYIYSNFGLIYAEKGNFPLALNYFKQGITISYQMFEYSNIIFSTHQIAKIYLQLNKPDSCIFYAKKSLAYAQQVKNYQAVVNACNVLAQIYEKQDTQKALQYSQLAMAAKDSLYNYEKTNALKNVTDFDDQERKYEIETAQTEYQNKVKLYALLAGLAIFSLIAFILFRNNRQKQKANVVLENTLTDLKISQNELELKNRDLEIEGALERVRSRSMEMHKSDELLEVIKVVFKELQDLGFNMENASFITHFHEDYWDFWQATPEYIYPTPIRIPYFDHPLFNKAKETLNQNLDLFTLKLNYDEKNEWWYHLFKHTIVNNIPEERKKYLLNTEGLAFSTVFMKNIALAISNYNNHTYTDQENQILKRFGNSFDQAYTRCLDLQKAEAQTREAEIEVSLERVRSRSMAMHKSDDLREVVQLVFEQFRHLDFKIDSANFDMSYNESDDMDLWTAIPGQPYSIRQHIPYINNAVFHRFKHSENGFFTFQEKNEFFKHFFRNAIVPEERQKMILGCSGMARSVVFMDTISLGIQNYAGTPYSEQEYEVLRRFGKVFQQTYTRFLDLKKAEAQAKEAEIELSLEKVRSRSMAMHKSDELHEVIKVIFEQLINLNFKIDSAQFDLNYKDSNDFDFWTAIPSQPYPFKLHIPYFDHPFLNQKRVAKEKGLNFSVANYTFEEKNLYFQHLFEYNPLIPEERKKYILNCPGMAVSAVLLKTISLWAGNYNGIPFSDDENAVLKRFALVFEQSYTRFLDLQKAEAQAEQAHRDLILIQTEKKRAEDALTILKATQNQLIQSEKLASLGELTAGIAHEIQNPLNFVNNFSELSVDLAKDLNEEIEKPEIDKEYVKELMDDLTLNQEKINLHGKRAASIVTGMLQHSQASSGKKELTDINKLADESLRLSYHGLRAKDKNFNSDFELIADPNLPKINVIPQDIGRVLINLINNAFYAVNVGRTFSSSVIVSTEKTDNQIVIKVKDNGLGIPENIKQKIFQPFFTTKPTGQGTGLGLSLAYDIITKGHGGTIEVESVEGEGTTFVVKLPI